MLELERTFLAKELPLNLKSCESKEVIDIYFPEEDEHPKIRLRKNGNKYELTKKEPEQEGDSSRLIEQNIILTKEEFDSLNKQLKGKRVRKIRYYYPYNELTAEIDVFEDDLKGLVLVDFEFKSEEEKNNFEIPEFCLTDITQEEFIAGGLICGKKYEDIKQKLEQHNYKKLFLEWKNIKNLINQQ